MSHVTLGMSLLNRLALTFCSSRLLLAQLSHVHTSELSSQLLLTVDPGVETLEGEQAAQPHVSISSFSDEI